MHVQCILRMCNVRIITYCDEWTTFANVSDTTREGWREGGQCHVKKDRQCPDAVYTKVDALR